MALTNWWEISQHSRGNIKKGRAEGTFNTSKICLLASKSFLKWKALKRVEGQCGTVLDHTPQLLSQQRHGDKIFNCSNFSSWQAFKCERMNTNTLKYTSAGPGSSCRGRGRRGSPSSPKWSVLILCWYTRQHRKPPKQPGPGWAPKNLIFLHPCMFLIFGCESSPISRNVRSLVSESVSQLDKCKIRQSKAK